MRDEDDILEVFEIRMERRINGVEIAPQKHRGEQPQVCHVGEARGGSTRYHRPTARASAITRARPLQAELDRAAAAGQVRKHGGGQGEGRHAARR
jgi:hypothetical protein